MLMRARTVVCLLLLVVALGCGGQPAETPPSTATPSPAPTVTE